MLARLRPHPHRGDTVAAGAVVLTVFAAVLENRFASTWSDGVRLVVILVLAAPIVAMALQSELLEERPRPYQAVLYVTAFVMTLLVLEELASALGSGHLRSAGTVVWVGLLLVAFSSWFAARRNSAIMTLLSALSAVVVVLAFVDWAFEAHHLQTYRWLLLLCAVALTLAAVTQRDLRRRHAVALVDVAGLSIAALGLTLVVAQVFSVVAAAIGGQDLAGAPAGWELVLLAFAFGLIAYGSVDRERVPAFLGLLVLSIFVAEAGIPGRDGASLAGWPIILAVIAVVLLVIGLRPRQELPPEPQVGSSSPPSPEPPPTGPTAVVEP
jgi:peptidoglycan/LPS O-acetylase OafA/YrhL